jgi:WD40 repeat protein
MKAFGFFGNLSPGGSHFIVGGGPVFGKKSVQIWDVNEKKLVGELTSFRSGVFSVAISHSGSLFALAGGDHGDGGDLSLWSVDDVREIAYTEFGKTPMSSIEFSPDDAILAAGAEDGFVLLYAVERLKGLSLRSKR